MRFDIRGPPFSILASHSPENHDPVRFTCGVDSTHLLGLVNPASHHRHAREPLMI